MLALVNFYREEHGLGALVLHRDLDRAAQRYAERMSKEGFFDHKSPDGQSYASRITEAGYQWLSCGENLALGQLSARQVMAEWIKSDSHRANLLNPGFTEIGMGFAVGISPQKEKTRPYWVQEFASPQP